MGQGRIPRPAATRRVRRCQPRTDNVCGRRRKQRPGRPLVAGAGPGRQISRRLGASGRRQSRTGRGWRRRARAAGRACSTGFSEPVTSAGSRASLTPKSAPRTRAAIRRRQTSRPKPGPRSVGRPGWRAVSQGRFAAATITVPTPPSPPLPRLQRTNVNLNVPT